MSVPLLTPQLLDDLKHGIDATGSRYFEVAQPGVPGSYLEEQAARVGLRVPEEARLLWQWCNGVRLPLLHDQIRDPSLLPGRRFLPIEEAIDLCVDQREAAAELAADHLEDPEFYWGSHWIPISERDGGPVAVDCRRETVAPVHSSHFDLLGVRHLPRAESLGQLVAWWIEALHSPAFRWDPGRGRWDYFVYDPPAALSASWL